MKSSHVYGVYQLCYIYAYYANGRRQLYCYDMTQDHMVLFEDAKTKTFKRLESATNLKWNADATVSFTIPASCSGMPCSIGFVNADTCENIYNPTYTGLKKADRVDTLYNVFDLESGNYYFTVQFLGDGKTYYDSEIVKSDVFQYVKPTEKMASITKYYWSDGYATIERPAGCTAEWAIIRFYYSDTEVVTKQDKFGSYGYAVFDSNGIAKRKPWDSMVNSNGTGYYAFEACIYSEDITKTFHGDFTALSEAYHLKTETDDVAKKLDDIDPQAQSAEDVRKKVADIGKDKLTTSLMADDKTAEKLDELEYSLGITKDVTVAPEVPVDASKIGFVGAGLNEVSASNITLKLSKPKAEHTIPAKYNNAVSVKFDMDIENVKNTGSLKVPVMITLPVPEGIVSSFLVILHYKNGQETPEEIHPVIFTGIDGKDYAQFVVSGFSDFILTQEKEKFAVTFDMQGHGTQIEQQLVASGSNAVKPADPTASGWTFGGWFKEAICENAWNFAKDIVEEATTLFAKWTKKEEGGGTTGGGSGSSITVIKPDAAVTPITLAKDGSQMMGSSIISRPLSKLTAEERASLVEAGSWTKDSYGRWTFKKADGTQIRAAWVLVSDALCSKPVGNASWYYFDANGYMVTGWVWITAADGKQYCYYFNKEDGSMYGACLLGGTTKDGYSLNAKGRWTDANGVEQSK